MAGTAANHHGELPEVSGMADRGPRDASGKVSAGSQRSDCDEAQSDEVSWLRSAQHCRERGNLDGKGQRDVATLSVARRYSAQGPVQSAGKHVQHRVPAPIWKIQVLRR